MVRSPCTKEPTMQMPETRQPAVGGTALQELAPLVLPATSSFWQQAIEP